MSRRTKIGLLVALVVAPGLLVTAVSGHYALQDWQQLQQAHARFRVSVAAGDSVRDLQIADAVQNMHRINLFAEVVWALQGMTLLGLGICTLCLLPPRAARCP